VRRGRGWPPVTSQGCQGWSQGFDTTLSGYMTDFDFIKKHQKTDNKKKRHGSRQGREMDSESARLAKEWRCVASIAGIMHRILITNL